MSTERRPARNAVRAELRVWYLTSLRPKVADAAVEGVIPAAAAAALEQQLRDVLRLGPGDHDDAA